ncbi:uncharacterized protein [Dermacentor albipictus]|uniref:uncharacterized protein isoform X2 n=1 Tax=Dermacentor albipictus TaxID=60249 RepID=UPI0038FC979E
MLISCRVYNTCKESTLDGMLSRCVLTAKGGRKRRRAASIAPWNMTQAEIVGTVIECSNAASQNTSSTFYTYLNMSEEFRRGYAKYMICAGNLAKATSVQLQVLDDAVAFGHKVALSYGWS